MAAFKKFKSARIGFVFRNLFYSTFYDFNLNDSSIFNIFSFLSKSIQPDAMQFVVLFYIQFKISILIISAFTTKFLARVEC